MAGNEPGGRSCTSFVCFTAQASCKALAYYDDYIYAVPYFRYFFRFQTKWFSKNSGKNSVKNQQKTL